MTLRVLNHPLVLFKVALEVVKDSQLFVEPDKCVSEMFVVDHKGAVVEVNCTL